MPIDYQRQLVNGGYVLNNILHTIESSTGLINTGNLSMEHRYKIMIFSLIKIQEIIIDAMRCRLVEESL